MIEFRGRIVALGQTERRGEKFSVRTVVLTDDDGKYPQFIKFEAHQQDCDKLDRFKVGMSALVRFELRGRSWTSREGKVDYFNTLKLVDVVELGQPESHQAFMERRINDVWP